jgi:hypothetical protein
VTGEDDDDEVKEVRESRGFWFYVVLLILLFGPIALGLFGAGLMMLNDALGFAHISQQGPIAAFLWIPIISLVTWPIAGVLIVVAVLRAILKGISQRGS